MSKRTLSAFLARRWAAVNRTDDVWLVTAQEDGTIDLNARVLYEFTGDDMAGLVALVERIVDDHNAALHR